VCREAEYFTPLKADSEDGPTLGSVGGSDGPFMCLHQIPGDAQTQTRSGGVRGFHETVEYEWKLIFRNTGPGVCHGDRGIVDRDIEATSLGHHSQCIADQVGDDPVPGTEIVVARLTDVLIIYVLRSYIEGLEPGEGGWLGALKDPAVREAIGLIHRNPDHPWTAEELANAAAMSRSAFFARFRETVGDTPAGYLTRWRIHLATRLLREQNMSVGAAGRQVGYGTEAAFSNAFLRVMGVRPGAYRKAA